MLDTTTSSNKVLAYVDEKLLWWQWLNMERSVCCFCLFNDLCLLWTTTSSLPDQMCVGCMKS